jgi:ribosomal protein L7Ae-like RNA K-turn-binding protein
MEGEEEQQLTGAVSVIAVPLAEKKLVKKLHKLVKKAAASKLLKRGVKEVVKVLRKADKFKGCVAGSAAGSGAAGSGARAPAQLRRARSPARRGCASHRCRCCCCLLLLLAAAAYCARCPAAHTRHPPPHTRHRARSLCIIAGDLSPIDVISHLPVLCEDHSVPYVFVPSKLGLGSAAATKRPTSCVLIPAGATKPGKGGEAWESEDKLVEAIEEVVGITPSR